MTVEQRIDEHDDQFPVGMRVLAVDDNPTCLMLLETLLRKCKYHVITTSQAITALKLLRENKNEFDLVISDVDMPDMDGFKLLELVGLELDLPVIMLSAYGDTKLVMKGISHGACDYLLKPVRIEELKNIWQHVVRRKKIDPRDHKNSEKPHGKSGEVGEGFTSTGDSDQGGKINRKRKDQNVDDDEEHDENGQNDEDPSTQKKPRVIWNVELHRKFVAAVNHLGIDKAVPKRILDMMNVEKLTRENVASHLQKYRLYLKRISFIARQQANMVAALGSGDSAYSRIGSLNGLGNLNTLSGSGQFQNAAFSSFSTGSVLGRLNTPAGLGMRGLSSSGMGPAQNSSNPVNDLTNFHPVIQPGNQNGNILQGMPTSLELDQLQHNKLLSYPISSGFSDMNINVGSSSNSIFDVPNLSSISGACFNSKFGSHLPDFDRCNEKWPSAIQSSGVQSDSFTFSDCFKQATPGDLRDNSSSVAIHRVMNPCDVSSIPSVLSRLPSRRTELYCQAAPVGSNDGQNMNFTPKQGRDHSNLMSSSMNSLISPRGVAGPHNQRLDPQNTICHINDDFNLIGQSNFANHLSMQHNEIELLAMDTTYPVQQPKQHGSYAHYNVGSLEDLVNVRMKQEQDKLMLMDGDFEFDTHSHGFSI